jgi:arylformamidase
LKILDISPPLSEKTAVFPGDVPFSRNVSLEFPKNHLTLSSVTTTLHLGAHADAEVHYLANGKGVEARDLSLYLGDCQVIKVTLDPGARIMPKDLEGITVESSRVLFRTDSYTDPNRWTDFFNSVSPELIDFLAARKVKLVGIDTPSIDPAESKALESHAAVARHKLAILEGLVLTHVNPGRYTLVALPLPIVGADASPVRAVLIEGKF